MRANFFPVFPFPLVEGIDMQKWIDKWLLFFLFNGDKLRVFQLFTSTTWEGELCHELWNRTYSCIPSLYVLQENKMASFWSINELKFLIFAHWNLHLETGLLVWAFASHCSRALLLITLYTIKKKGGKEAWLCTHCSYLSPRSWAALLDHRRNKKTVGCPRSRVRSTATAAASGGHMSKPEGSPSKPWGENGGE